MIHVRVDKDDGQELARIQIHNIERHPDSTADYGVRFVVERGAAVGMHMRVVHCFPRNEYNALALVRQALATLEEEELKLEQSGDPRDMARKQRRALPKIPRWKN